MRFTDFVIPYPDTGIMRGDYTPEQKLRADAEWLYNQMICDRRYTVEDVVQLIRLWDKERNG
jgi:hypothetical protein